MAGELIHILRAPFSRLFLKRLWHASVSHAGRHFYGLGKIKVAHYPAGLPVVIRILSMCHSCLRLIVCSVAQVGCSVSHLHRVGVIALPPMKHVAALLMCLALVGCDARAQPRQTKSWTLTPPKFGTLTVYDLSGVCLYVMTYGSWSGVSAVSKAQLPAGSGCE